MGYNHNMLINKVMMTIVYMCIVHCSNPHVGPKLEFN